MLQVAAQAAELDAISTDLHEQAVAAQTDDGGFVHG